MRLAVREPALLKMTNAECLRKSEIRMTKLSANDIVDQLNPGAYAARLAIVLYPLLIPLQMLVEELVRDVARIHGKVMLAFRVVGPQVCRFCIEVVNWMRCCD